jgi:hypothetical protein
MVTQVRYSVTGRSRCRVILCVVCIVHKETRIADFLVELKHQVRRFVSGLASKPLGWFVSGLTSKPLGRFVSCLTSKPLGRFLSGLASKPLGRFLPVCPQNWWCGFPGFDLKTSSYSLVIWDSKSPR